MTPAWKLCETWQTWVRVPDPLPTRMADRDRAFALMSEADLIETLDHLTVEQRWPECVESGR